MRDSTIASNTYKLEKSVQNLLVTITTTTTKLRRRKRFHPIVGKFRINKTETKSSSSNRTSSRPRQNRPELMKDSSELKKLEFILRVSTTSFFVRRFLRRKPGKNSPTWKFFKRIHEMVRSTRLAKTWQLETKDTKHQPTVRFEETR